jgi:hypothetical protein
VVATIRGSQFAQQPLTFDGLLHTGGQSHKETVVGSIVLSTTLISSAASVSRSTSWRSRALNAWIVRAAL